MTTCSGAGTDRRDDGACDCSPGFFGDDCSDSLDTVAREAWWVETSVLACAFLAVSLGFCFRVAQTRLTKPNDGAVAFERLRSTVLCLAATSGSLCALTWAIDPLGTRGVLPLILVKLLANLSAWVLLATFFVIALGWVEFAAGCKRLLAKENYLAKIAMSRQYRSNLTTANVLDRIQPDRETRAIWTAILMAVLALAIWDAFCIGSCTISIMRYAFDLFAWTTCTAFLGVYGKRVISLIPESPLESKKAVAIFGLSGLALISRAAISAAPGSSAAGVMVSHGIHAALLVLVLCVLLTVYESEGAWFPVIFSASRRSANNSDLPSNASDSSSSSSDSGSDSDSNSDSNSDSDSDSVGL